MSLVEAQNGWVFFDKVKEERSIAGGFEVISKDDRDFRVSRGIAISVSEGIPLKEGDKFLYEERHAHDVYVGKKLLMAVTANRILGKINENTEQ